MHHGNAVMDSILPSHDKRKDPRRQALWNVMGEFSNGEKFNVMTVNVSKSGLLLDMHKSIKIGSRAKIKIFAMINGSKYLIDSVVEIVHEVLSQNKFQCGIKFLWIKREHRILLSNYAQNKRKVVNLTSNHDYIESSLAKPKTESGKFDLDSLDDDLELSGDAFIEKKE